MKEESKLEEEVADPKRIHTLLNQSFSPFDFIQQKSRIHLN